MPATKRSAATALQEGSNPTANASSASTKAGPPSKKRNMGKKKEKFYAVAVGFSTGVTKDWFGPGGADEAIKGCKGAKFKSFLTREEAKAWVHEHGGQNTIANLEEKGGEDGLTPSSEPEKTTTREPGNKKEAVAKKPTTNVFKEDPTIALSPNPGKDGVLKIWTDGSSRGNGRVGARAGYGVFFAPNDPRNLSEPLPGEPQTNQRAELLAIQRALELAPSDQDIRIISDSNYSINCIQVWAENWKKKGWKKSSGEPVMNLDIIEPAFEAYKARLAKKGVKTDFRWVKGHEANEGNVAVDKLAVEGASKGLRQ